MFEFNRGVKVAAKFLDKRAEEIRAANPGHPVAETMFRIFAEEAKSLHNLIVKVNFDALAAKALSHPDLDSLCQENGWTKEEFLEELDRSVESGTARAEDALNSNSEVR
jgi:hypothetical protein